MCEEFGIGVPPELAADAAENYKKGAKAGNADAQYRLSQLYAKGANGVEKNLMVALGWARKAAAQGHADAKAFLQEQKMIEKSKVSLDYTKAAETADSYIEKTTRTLCREHRVRVATSDGMEQLIILGNGAYRISAEEFRQEVKQTEQAIRTYLDSADAKSGISEIRVRH